MKVNKEMLVDCLPIGPIQTNCYLVTCAETRKAVIIDPGWPDQWLLEKIQERNAQIVLVVNTHSHFDHIGGNAFACRMTNSPLAIHQDAVPMLKAKGGAEGFGLHVEPSPEPTQLLNHGETIHIGRLSFEIRFTPGHAPGHISLVEHTHLAVFDGDVLFNRGIGRVDLPGGNMNVLMESIKTQLFTLPDETVVYSGHGPKTTIGEEKQENPWL